jgi:glycerate 2-kinase
MKPISRLRQDARQIFTAALNAADPARAVSRHVKVENEVLDVDGRLYPLKKYRKIVVVGAGKGSAQMFRALDGLLGDWLYSGIIIVKYGYSVPASNIVIIEAGHPIPDENGLRGTKRLIDLVRHTTSEDLVVCLLSGGGSALLCSPAESVSLEEKQQMTELLLRCGAPIQEINTIRKHMSKVKGGHVAELAYPSALVALILSDVVDNSIATIASGPTAPDVSTFSECRLIINKYDLVKKIPRSVAMLIDKGCNGEITETPKPGDPIFRNVLNVIVGDNRLALDGAKQQAQSLGYSVTVRTDLAEGEAAELAADHAAMAKQSHQSNNAARPACIVSGGEATVTLRGEGLGGRNQEFALAAAIEIQALDGIVILSGATDGTDGPTDAAGGVVDGGTVQRGHQQGLEARDYLNRNDSYHYLCATDDLIVTGPTFTNVMDIRLILVDNQQG